MKSHPTWVRGLKLCGVFATVQENRVPPYVGAWIETTWQYIKEIGIQKSHPTWVRGLKHHKLKTVSSCPVAPYVGAWIETCILQYLPHRLSCRTLRGCVD